MGTQTGPNPNRGFIAIYSYLLSIWDLNIVGLVILRLSNLLLTIDDNSFLCFELNLNYFDNLISTLMSLFLAIIMGNSIQVLY